MIKTILFDLDGTLLGLDLDTFTKPYLYNIYNFSFKDLMSLEQCAKTIYQTVSDMVEDDTYQVDIEKFYRLYKKYYDYSDLSVFRKKVESYYDSDKYFELEKYTKRQPFMIEAVKYLKSKKYKIVIATNPIFPPQAIKERIKWAGLDVSDFEFVTYSDEFHYIKPNLKYYEEVLTKLNIKDNSEVLMVGNDVEEDMIASKLNVHTYLITDYMISRFGNEKNIREKGSSEDFLKYIKENF